MPLQFVKPAAVDERSAGQPVAALGRLLDELATLLIGIEPEVYCDRPLSRASGSIGEHVRHCLDHVAALLAAGPRLPLCYDQRERGTSIETSPLDAVRQMLRFKAALARWRDRSLDEPIRLTLTTSASGEAFTTWSTLGRELAFVASHTIHHQAMIAVLVSLSGIEVPDRFGYSPSTPVGH